MKILQYCSVCKVELEMSVVPTSEEEGIVWLQCPRCDGFLPKTTISKDFENANEAASEPEDNTPAEEPETELDIEADSEESDNQVVGVEENEASKALQSMDAENAISYKPWKTYQPEDVIHHLAWDDYGVVLEKETLPGNRHIIKVVFDKAGIVRLIEDDGDQP